jgi:hypothetical protein
VAATIATKLVSYHDQHLEDDLILLVIEIYGCLHQHVDDLLHQCANKAWLAKGFGGLPLFILCSFYRQRVLMAL